MTLDVVPAPRHVGAPPPGPGADLAAGGDVVAPRAWWPAVNAVLREIEAGTGGVLRLHESSPTAPADPLLRVEQVAEVPGLTAACGPEAVLAEGYALEVSGGRVLATASTAVGAAHALQTLRQLLDPAAFRRAGRGPAVAGPVSVLDAPRHGWRGLMLDVARHWHGVRWTYDLIDALALHKLNVLHLHLTDDQGWRLQVDAFPRLTEVGAWRRETLVGYRFSDTFDGRPHGGFYTKADIADIVAYAADRGITVVPEIDMPGHMLAAIASYPEWGTTGAQLEVLTRWARTHNVLDLSEATVAAMKTILDEVVELFPSPYIHIGGDECPRTEWVESPRVQQLIAERGLADEDELQHWFTRQLGVHLASRGRRLLGWDEILNGRLPADATVMAWRSEDEARAALALGHDIVVANQEHLYLDYKQSRDAREPLGPRIFAHYLTDLREVYEYEWLSDLPAEQRARVLGAQVCLWTEFISSREKAEYMIFPRTCAFAERVWNGAVDDFDTFLPRLTTHLARLEARQIAFRGLDGPTQGQSDTWWGVEAEAPPRLSLSSDDSPAQQQ
ncbi:beta-N-acetylhexosaminidase [Desertihabitans brevis]|uniref:beta-N-acetylhexosaminidase n=1 Tax=Desertihabitans brevis TaxID=2268447 RepID=UPI001314C861|nr:beta-N-acetylhexosaminidase [Desertihabitans brevis]